MRTKAAVAALLLTAASLAAALPADAGAPFVGHDFRGSVVTTGADGNVWYSGPDGTSLLRVDATGATTTVATTDVPISDIAPGLAGDPVWFTAVRRIGRVHPDRTVSYVDLPSGVVASELHASADGRVYFVGYVVEDEQYVVGTIDAAGAVEHRPVPFSLTSAGLGTGPDGAVWVTAPFATGVGRIGDDLDVELVPIAGAIPDTEPITGPDGLLWFVVPGFVVRLDAEGGEAAPRIPVPVLDQRVELAIGPGGDVWVPARHPYGPGFARIDAAGRPRLLAAGFHEAVPVPSGAEEVAVAHGRLWWSSGHVDIEGIEIPVVTATVAGDRVTVAVTGDAGPATGRVDLVQVRCCHHGIPALNVVGSAELDAAGRAVIVAPQADAISGYYADYEGDGTYAGTLSNVAAPAAAGSRWEAYVRGTYRVVLGREGDPGGIAHWTAVLDATGSPARFAQELVASVEWRARAVDAAYREILGRPPDAGGLGFFVDVLGRGRRLAEVRASLAASDEFAATHPDWVGALYDALLRRPADAGGRAYLEGLLRAGRPRAVVAGSVAASPEAFGRTVDALYALLLGRAPDPGGRAFWVGEMVAGRTEAGLVVAITGSPEFIQRVEAA